MKKKISVILLSLVICLCTATSAIAVQSDGFANDHEHVRDLAGLLSDSEEAALSDKLNELSER